MEEKAIVKFTTYEKKAPVKLLSPYFFGGLAIILIIGAILLNLPAVTDVYDSITKTVEVRALQSAGFEVKTIDSKPIATAELVQKNGRTYELLCEETAIREVPMEETYECELTNYSDPVYKTILNKTTDKEQEVVDYYKTYTSSCSRKVMVNESYCAKKSGEVKVGSIVISMDRYFCGVEGCDEVVGICPKKKVEYYPCEKETSEPVYKTIIVQTGDGTIENNTIEREISVIDYYKTIMIPTTCRRVVDFREGECIPGRGDSNGDGKYSPGENWRSYEEYL